MDEVRITLPAGQKVNGPLAEIVGMMIGVMLTVTGVEVPPQLAVVVTL
jgi:hypothetical protein